LKKLEKYAYWIMLSDYDMDTIDTLITGKRWVYVTYLCQQAVERQLKGMYVYYMDAEAPKTHNVTFLFNKIANCPAFADVAKTPAFKNRRDECEDFLVDAMFYYMSDYPFSYKNITSRFVGESVAMDLYHRAKDYVAWLRAFQPEVDIPSEIPAV